MEHGGNHELWLVMLGLLAASWRAVGYRYSELTPQERELVTPEQHARLVLLMRHGRPVDGASVDQRAAQLADRAVMYGQGAIDGLELEASPGDEYTMNQATADMERITAMIARGFCVGYGACIDDQHAAPRLGGVTERRKGKR